MRGGRTGLLIYSEGLTVISPLSMETYRDASASSGTERRALDMLTLGEFIAVISVCLASFSLGYKLGRDRSSRDTKNEQE